jgi:DNA polymerase I-like protein with 3'-5' exonuclease and polymerase domains
MDRETLERLEQLDKFASPIINTILFLRDLNKTLQVLETEVDFDWRWRCSYNIGGTTTGRWSSSKSPLGTGNNFQNINEELRRIFVPDDGFKLYGIDKSQSEARDVGWFAGTTFGDWSYLNACESGDLHTYVTRMLYPEWDWTGDLRHDRAIANRRFYRLFTYRDASKRLAHASNYFGKPAEISRQTRIPLNLVEEFQRRYFAAFPCIQKMHQWIIQHLQRHRYLVNSFGRHRDFFDRPESHETIKSAIAYMFQSATGDALNLGLWRLWRHMRGKIQVLSQLHDAVYFQAKIPINVSEEQNLLRDCLACIEIAQRDPKSGRRMTIPAEAVGGFNWAHSHRLLEDGTVEEWNPRGLREIKLQ